jgi:hypothetical protein
MNTPKFQKGQKYFDVFKIGQKIMFGNGIREVNAVILTINEKEQTAIVQITPEETRFYPKRFADGKITIDLFTVTAVEA